MALPAKVAYWAAKKAIGKLIKSTREAAKSKTLIDIRVDRNRMASRIEQNLPNKREIDQRISWMQRYLAYNQAKYLAEQVKAEIPKSPKYDTYRNSIRMVNQPDAYGISIADMSKERAIEPKADAIYVLPKKSRLVPVKKELLVLYRYSPWTADTLPFTPNPKDASLVLRPSNPNSIREIRKEKIATQRKWRAELLAAGAKVGDMKYQQENQNKDTGDNLLRGSDMISPLLAEAVKLEFGTPGQKATPHWKPALEDTNTNNFRRVAKQLMTFQVVMDYGWRGWTKPFKRVKYSISDRDFKQGAAFRRALGVKNG